MNPQEPPSEGPGTEPSIGKESLPALGPVEVPQLEPFPENPNRILLVEDREDDAMYFKRILGHAGFAMPVYTVNDGNSAIAYLQGDPPYANRTKYPLPSIVMLDLYMPNKGGFEVLSWIRARPQFRNIF